MKYVISNYWYGFMVPDEICTALDCDVYDDSDEIRTSPELIKWVESHTDDAVLKVVVIPDNATDYEVDEYEGWENVIAVVNGKIVHL